MAKTVRCVGCKEGRAFDTPFSMAFQPIIDLTAGRIWGYEALIRGPKGEPAQSVLSTVNQANKYAFDQACRRAAIELASRKMPAGSTAMLSINFMPNAIYEPKGCIRVTLEAAARMKFNVQRLMFEFTEHEQMTDVDHVARIVGEYKRMGFTTAIDDFGAGFAGLGLLAQFQTDIVKLDMDLIRGIDASESRQAIVGGLISMSKLMKFQILAEGVETEREARTLVEAGITMQQGYYFARPAFETCQSDDEIVALAGFKPEVSTGQRKAS